MLASHSDQGLTVTLYFIFVLFVSLCMQHFQKTLGEIAWDTEVPCFFHSVIFVSMH